MTRRGTRRAVGLLLTGALLVGGCQSAPERRDGPSGAPSSPDFRPGAAGIGDDYFPTYGNGGYDVDRYTVRVRYDPADERLTGATTIEATAVADLSSFNLDLSGLTVSKVTVDGADARHRQEGSELVVTPAAGLRTGTGFRTEVTYAGRPQPIENETLGEGGWLHTVDGAIALGQPESASSWFPVNDHPSDKATYDFEITVPEGLTAVSNGVPQGRSSADGWTTWKWAERVPMASYLSTVVIGRFRVSTGEHKGRPVYHAVSTGLPKGPADESIAATVRVADYLETLFGPYPVQAYGGVAIADHRIRYALETQSRPVYGPSFFAQGSNVEVVVHELAHQWFGNSVALTRWSDIWLNEGFATYAEWLWREHDGGPRVQQTFDARYAEASPQLWSTPPGRPGPENLFSESVYQRGAMTVHALRLAVGDDAFFRILKTWAAEKRDANATTDEFVALAERISGKQLDDVFDPWLYGTRRPTHPQPR
ncbi:M1 family metallopeptidase [Micromonospora sp. SH-82]